MSYYKLFSSGGDVRKTIFRSKISIDAYLASTGLTIRENGAVVAVHDTHHKVRRADIVNMLLLHFVVKHGIEKEVLGRFRIVGLGVSDGDLATFRISRSSSMGTFKEQSEDSMTKLYFNEKKKITYTRFPFLISSPKRGRILTTTFTVSSGLLMIHLIFFRS